MNKWEQEENEAGKTSKAETEYQTQEKYEHYAKIRNSLRGKGETVLQKHCVDYTNIKQSVQCGRHYHQTLIFLHCKYYIYTQTWFWIS